MTTTHRPTVLGDIPANPTNAAEPVGVLATRYPVGGMVEQRPWLVAQRNAGVSPDEIASTLVSAGWDADGAAAVAMRSLRQSDHNRVLWAALCWSTGLAAVGLTSGVHQLLSVDPNRHVAAVGLTAAAALAPIAAVLAHLAGRVESRSRFALWSPERRFWFATLAGCTAAVGVFRLLAYVYQVIAALVGASGRALEARDLAQVAVTVGIAVPLFVWSYRQWRRSDVVMSGLHHETDTDGA